MTHLSMKTVHLCLINFNVESLLLLSMIKVKSRKYTWSSDLFSVINGFFLHNMIVIAPHSTRAACYTILLISNTKRRKFFLVRGHSESDLESSVILVTSNSSNNNSRLGMHISQLQTVKNRLYRDQILLGMS